VPACLLALLALLVFAAPAFAVPVEARFALEPGHAAHVRVVAADGAVALDARTMDGSSDGRFGWLADLDPAPGAVTVALDALLLPEGAYALHVRTPTGETVSTLQSDGAAARVVSVRAPAGATAVLAERERGGGPAAAWATVGADGLAQLPLDEGEWSVVASGVPGASIHIQNGGTAVIGSAPRAWPRRAPTSSPWVVRLLLLPITLLVLAAGGASLVAIARRRGGGVAMGAAFGLAALATAGTLAAPGTRLLMSEPGFTDPPTSASLAAATADALLSLSDVSTLFAFPEGHSWLPLGPSWLAYVLAAPFAWLGGGVVAHNLGQTICLALLGIVAWALARDRGAGPVAALLASAGAVLAPCLLAELDEMSLDRAALFGVPAFILCLNRAAERPGWRWPAATGLALASVLYAQTYYGLYLAAAAPLLVLPRLLGRHSARRLGRLSLAGGACLVVVIPFVVAAQAGLEGTVYASDDALPVHVLEDPLAPVAPEELADWVRAYDPRVGGGDPDRPMESPNARLLTAVINSNHPSDVLRPGAAVAGGAAFWGLWLLALAVSRRRAAVLIGGWDVLVLLVLSLGPLWRSGALSVGSVLPYHLYYLLVPGFDQLKHPQRFIFLAAAISTVPLAVGWSGLLERLQAERTTLRRALGLGATLLLAAALPTVAIRTSDEVVNKRHLPIPFGSRPLALTANWTWPVARAFPVPGPLAELPPAAAILLPLDVPLPTRATVGALQAGLRLVNSPPHGTIAGGEQQAAWTESNALLNRVAWLSGSTRPRRPLGEPGPDDLHEVEQAGLRYVVLYRDLLRAPELLPPLDAFMDARFSRIAEGDGVTVWTLW
jgi:hypothetical protein